MKYVILLLGMVLPTALAGSALAEQPQKEDLSACKLPHAELLLPDRNAPKAARGYFLRFSDQTLNPSPFKSDKQPRSIKKFFDRLRSERTGDLIYSSLNNGTFVAISGRISDLGSHFLHELSGRQLSRPAPVQSTKERTGAGEATPGAIEGLHDGHCYLLETVDGKFALVRVVQKRGRLALIQYVYQPDGSLSFEIPKGGLTKLRPWVKPRPFVPRPPATVPGKVTDVPTLLAIRAKMIVKLIATVKQPAKTPQDIMAKADAIKALGKLRASEAAPMLVQEIEFRNPYALSDATTIAGSLPCVPALQAIGKPGSLAALAAVEKLRLDGPKDKLTKAKFRLKLLVMVIAGVEGREVGEFMIKMKIKHAPALEEALRMLRK